MTRLIPTRRTLLQLAAAAPLAAPCLARAQAGYPDRAISMLIGFAAGGTTDIQGRVLARALSEELGQPVAVVNRPGAGGAVGATQLKTAAPDGYTILFGNSTTLTFNPLVSQVAYKLEDFRILGAVALSQPAVVVRGDSPIQDFPGMIAAARATPGLTYAMQTQLDRLIMATIAKKENVQIRIIPTQGGGGMVPLLLGGQIQAAYSGGIHVNHTPSGAMRVIASYNQGRLVAYPDVPSLTEMGYPYAADNQRILVAPAALPAEIAARLEAALQKASAHPDFIDVTENRLKFPARFVPSAAIQAQAMQLRDGFAEMVRELAAQ